MAQVAPPTQLNPARGGRWRAPGALTPRAVMAIRISANLVGAAGAAYFAYATLQVYLQNHQLIGVAFFAEQTVVVLAYLLRRPARVVTSRWGDWLLAFGGTFTPVLLRPDGAHPGWGLNAGLGLQLAGLTLAFASFFALGRSFGFAAADRGLVRRGPYAVVRHPVYAAYVLLQLGYLFQSLSVRNALVVLASTGFNAGRAVVEDRVLATNPDHAAYRRSVRWRLCPGIW